MNENVKRILDQKKQSPKLREAYEKAANSIAPVELQNQIDSSVESLLFDIAKRNGWIPDENLRED